MTKTLVFILIFTVSTPVWAQTTAATRPRAREIGIMIGILPTGQLNSITDVAGVGVGQTTIIKGENVRTGVTAILPHNENLFKEKVPGAVFVANGFGKLAGSTQVNELGEIETPILLTSTLSVPKTADFLMDYMLALPGNEDVRSINPLVAETNDGGLNDIRGRHITRDDVFNALKTAKTGTVEEGSVGAGTGTVAFGWKGGIGTSSRKLPVSLGGYTLGVLVQSNFGGVLTIDGVPVGEELGKYYLKDAMSVRSPTVREGSRNPVAIPTDRDSDMADGSIIIVIATDAPLDHRQLKRLASRSMIGLGRTGSSMTNGSGDYAIAFSTANRINALQNIRDIKVLGNDAMSPLFQAVIEATEEAIINSLFKATTVTGNGRTVEAIPIERVLKIVKNYRNQNEYSELTEEYAPLVVQSNLSTENMLSKYSKMDFSNVWLTEGRSGYLGFFGPDYRRIRIKLDTVKKDPKNPNIYRVSGRSAVSTDITKLSGAFEIARIIEFKQFSAGVDDEPPADGVKAQGLLLGTYTLNQDKLTKSTGVFSGVFSARWYLNAKGEMKFDDIEKLADPYRNNQFIGKWTLYDGKNILISNWGDYRIPQSGDLDIGACCFSPDSKYRQNGWETYEVDQPDKFNWNRP